jgi:hypothetical protein
VSSRTGDDGPSDTNLFSQADVARVTEVTTMRTRSFAFVVGTITLCALLIGGSPASDDSRGPHHDIPQGFRAEYLVIETTNGLFTVLRQPQLRMLGDRTYLVGRTVSQEGVTDDALFAPTTQWVCLLDVRRMGEVASDAELRQIREIAAEQRAIREELARSRK